MILNSKSEFNRCYLPRLVVDKEGEEQVEAARKKEMEEKMMTMEQEEQDTEVAKELQRLVDKGFAILFSSWEQLVKHLGRDPVVSKMKVITK